MAESLLDIVVRVRDEATSVLEKIGISTEKLIKAGLEPLAAIAPTLAHALENMITSMGPVGLGVAAIGGAAVGATAALFELAHATAEYGHELELAHLKTGVSIEGLEGLKVAAAEVGQGLESVTTAFRFLDRNLQAAADGGDRQAEAFKKIGLSAQALLQEAPDQRFVDIAKALSQMTDTSERNAIGIQLLGRSFLNLLPIINQVGQGGLDPFIQKAKDLGIALTEADVAASGKMIATMGDLKLAFEGIGYQLGAALLPSMTDLAKIFLDAAKQAIQFEHDTGLIAATARFVGNTIHELEVVIRAAGAAYKWWQDLITAGGYSRQLEQIDLEKRLAAIQEDRATRARGWTEEEIGSRQKVIDKIQALVEAADKAELEQTIAELKGQGDRSAIAQAEYDLKVKLIEDEKEKRYDAIRALEGTNAYVEAGVQIEREAAAKIGVAWDELKDKKIKNEQASVDAVAKADEQILASEIKLVKAREDLAKTNVSAGSSVYEAQLSALDKVTQAEAKAREARFKADGDTVAADKVASDARITHLQIQMELELKQHETKIKSLQIELDFNKQIDEIEERRLNRQIIAAQKQLETETDVNKRIELQAKIADLQDQILEKKLSEEASQKRINAEIEVARTEMSTLVTVTNLEVQAEQSAASAASGMASAVSQAAQTVGQTLDQIQHMGTAGIGGGGGGGGTGPLGSQNNPYPSKNLNLPYGGFDPIAGKSSVTGGGGSGIDPGLRRYLLNGGAAGQYSSAPYTTFNDSPYSSTTSGSSALDSGLVVYGSNGQILNPWASGGGVGYPAQRGVSSGSLDYGGNYYGDVPYAGSYAEGGFVPQTGMALVHAGEYVVPKGGWSQNNPSERGPMTGFVDQRTTVNISMEGSGFSAIPNQRYMQDLSATMGNTISEAQARNRLIG